MPTTPPDTDDAFVDGERLLHGRYRLTARLGSGGMADVFLAEDVRLGRHVAVKVLRAPFAADDEFVERFRIEAQAAALLNHPNIVAVYDRGHADGQWYLVMEYVRGETLKQRLQREGRLATPEAASIAGDLLAALQAAHARHIVHRDVSAQNVLLADDGRVKVADFGIARIGASGLTRSGMMMGTCHYISPEQARGLPADERSDIYGAGIVLYEMLTGRVPFAADSDVAVALKHVNEAPPRPRDLEPAIPEAVEGVVLRALEKDPARRFQTAAEFAAALDEALLAPSASPRGAGVPAAESGVPAFVAPPPPLPPPASPSVSPPAPPPATAVVATGAPAATAVLSGTTGATTVRPPRRRVWRRLALVALLLFAAAAAGIAVYTFVIAASTAVPKVVGRTEAQARALLRDADLRTVTHRVYLDGVVAGAVARQRPKAGVEVDDGARVEIWVSRGPLHVPAPVLRGLSAADAKVRLADADLASDRRNGRSDSVAEGRVFHQEPAAGQTVERGDAVTYWVSTGPRLETVPDVVGLSSNDAAAELDAAGFTVNVDVVFGWGAYPDTVVEQDPEAGKKVESGSEVSIGVAVF